jgi:glycosyltransferase involved in cell wall biosynthesis
MLLSIIVPVFKPEKHLEELFADLISQKLPSGSNLEIIVVDGENSNFTKIFCERKRISYFANPDQDPVIGRYIGYKEAGGELICFIDQDERFTSELALNRRINSFLQYKKLVALFPSGYEIGPYMSTANMYSSLFGDPFNHFFYNQPNDNYRANGIFKRLEFEEDEQIFLNSKDNGRSNSVLMEFGNMGTVLSKERLNKIFDNDILAEDIPNLFYKLTPNIESVGILKNDLIKHYSSTSWKSVRSKIRWRVRNNLQSNSSINASSLSQKFRNERNEKSKSLAIRFLLVKKIIFVILVVIPVWPLLSTLMLIVKYKRIQLLNAFLLNYYLIFVYVALKVRFVLKVRL